MGVDPSPLTLRELWWMLHGRQKAEWAHTSLICAVVSNSAPRGKKGRRRAAKPGDFSPYKSRAAGEQMTFKQLLKKMAGDKRKARVVKANDNG